MITTRHAISFGLIFKIVDLSTTDAEPLTIDGKSTQSAEFGSTSSDDDQQLENVKNENADID